MENPIYRAGRLYRSMEIKGLKKETVCGTINNVFIL